MKKLLAVFLLCAVSMGISTMLSGYFPEYTTTFFFIGGCTYATISDYIWSL